MAKYTVKGTDILYNGKLYAEGVTISPDDDTAAQLTDYLELIPEKTTTKQTKSSNTTDEANKSTAETPTNSNTTTDGGVK